MYADWADSIAKDCEVVRHQSPAAVGAFSGTSSQNEGVTFQVPAGGKTVTHFRINSLNQSCDPANHVATFGPLDYGTVVYPLGQQGAFTASYARAGDDQRLLGAVRDQHERQGRRALGIRHGPIRSLLHGQGRDAVPLHVR